MTEEMKALICCLFGFIIAITGIVITIVRAASGKSKKEKFIENAKQNGCFTKAKAVFNKHHFGNDGHNSAAYGKDREIVVYEYTVNGKKYTKKIIYEHSGTSSDYPYEITVYYNPKNPKKIVREGEVTKNSKAQVGCFTTIFVTILAMKGIVELLEYLF